MAPAATLRSMPRLPLLLPLVLLLAACSGADPEPPRPAPDPPAFERYVALGDSFTAGPLVPPTDDTSGACARSFANYPHVLADELDVELTDVSCSGAETTHVVAPNSQHSPALPAQVEAVDARTDLVTIGIGGNDDRLYASLAFSCTQARGNGDPRSCRELVGADVERALAAAPARLARTFAAVKAAAAPDARVVAVGYPRLVPESGTCDVLGLDESDVPWVGRTLERLDAAMAAAADRAGVEHLSLLQASRGHDICAGEDAWVKGGGTDLTRAAPYHPFDTGMRGVADALLEQLSD